MSIEQPVDQAPTRREMEPTYFVGRRHFEAAEVYVVTATVADRVRSTRRYGQLSLDWQGSSSARMELSHVLISHVAEQRPANPDELAPKRGLGFERQMKELAVGRGEDERTASSGGRCRDKRAQNQPPVDHLASHPQPAPPSRLAQPA